MKGESVLSRDDVRAYIAGIEIESPDVLVVGGSVAARRRIEHWTENVSSLADDAVDVVLVHLDDICASRAEAAFAALRRIAAGRLVCVLSRAVDLDAAEGNRLDLLSTLRAAEANRLVLIGFQRQEGDAQGPLLLEFAADSGLEYTGERLNLLGAPSKTVYEHVARYLFASELVRGKVLRGQLD